PSSPTLFPYTTLFRSLRIEEERVVHLARGMAFREVQLGEVVVVGLDVGTFRDREAHIGEDRGQLVHHLAERMDAAGLGRRILQRSEEHTSELQSLAYL